VTTEPGSRQYPFGPPEALDLHPAYEELRACPELTRVQPPFGRWTYLATRYDDVRFVLSDSRLSRAGIVGEDEPRAHPFITDPSALSALDPPEHTRLRRVLMGAFTARRVEELRPRIQQIVDKALDDVVEQGPPADLVALFAVPVPTTVMAELLGVPATDRAWFMDRSQVVLSADAGRTPEEIMMAYQEIIGYLAGKLEERRQEPRDDLLSALVQVHDSDQDRLSAPEMVNIASTVLIAGHETTINQLANVIYVLLTHEDKAKALRADPTRVPAAVEELLRVAPIMATGGFARVATEDVRVGETVVRAGECVMPVHYAANRDERVFPDPEEIDFSRPNAGTHVAFSYGPHHCPGSHLARLELQLAVTTLLARFPDLAMAVASQDLSWRRQALTRGPHTLPVTWGG
jgi:cytochrome P450